MNVHVLLHSPASFLCTAKLLDICCGVQADIFTPSELAAFRLHVQKRILAEETKLGRPITWRTADPHNKQDEQGPEPPFAVIASNHTDLAVGRWVCLSTTMLLASGY